MNIGESNELKSDRRKARRHNAKRCRFATRQAIIYALANDESVESVRRKYHVSRHTVLEIREQCSREIEAARERIAAVIESRCYELANQALDKIERQIEVERSPVRLLKICDKLTDKAAMLRTPVQTNTPEPFEVKFGKFRRAKRNEKLSGDRSVWHEAENKKRLRLTSALRSADARND